MQRPKSKLTPHARMVARSLAIALTAYPFCARWEALRVWAMHFEAKHNREPTVWFGALLRSYL